jgi:RNA polymerase sigma factor (sigma-70 family)
MSFRTEWDRLLIAARAGDVHALGHLLEAAGEDLRNVAAGVLGRPTQTRLPAEDVFADALLAVLGQIGTLRATSYVGFRYWFASIARNHVRRILRGERSRPAVRAEEHPEPEGAPHPDGNEGQGLMRHVLERLPRSQQVAFVLREGLMLTWHTIGFVLERREAAAARLVHYRALSRVKGVAITCADLRLLVVTIQA